MEWLDLSWGRGKEQWAKQRNNISGRYSNEKKTDTQQGGTTTMGLCHKKHSIAL